MSESEWWDQLEGEEIENNAYGVPHYDMRQVANFIASHINFDSRVLDLGCGPGRLGHELARRHPNGSVYGVDVSPQMIELSHNHAPDNWLSSVNDGETIPNGPYSGAYCVTVFQHIPWSITYRYVEQVYQQLQDGGKFIFTYAVGKEDTFLSHQVSHELALGWLINAGFKGNYLPTPLIHPRWHWAVGMK